jgi:type IV secretory pathway VirB9-like protein
MPTNLQLDSPATRAYELAAERTELHAAVNAVLGPDYKLPVTKMSLDAAQATTSKEHMRCHAALEKLGKAAGTETQRTALFAKHIETEHVFDEGVTKRVVNKTQYAPLERLHAHLHSTALQTQLVTGA